MKFLKSIFSLAVLTLITFNAFSQLANKDRGCIPLRVDFTPPSGASTFVWDLGDGNILTDRNPVNNYTSPGTFIIQFREVNGGPVTATDTVFVFDKPTVDFEADTLIGCVPLEVNFTSTLIADPSIPITYDWAFGDGRAGSGPNPTHIYTTPGTRRIGLDILSTLDGCTAFAEKEDYITVNLPPAPLFIADKVSACAPPLEVQFSNETVVRDNIEFSWDFGNGQVITTTGMTNPGLQIYNQIGDFTAMMTATDTITGCSNTSTLQIGVGSPPASFTIADTVCTGVVIRPSGVPTNLRYNWTVTPDIIGSPAFVSSPTFIFGNSGEYEVSLTVTDPVDLCTNTFTRTIYAEELIPDFTIDPTALCDLPGTKTYTAIGSGFDVAWSIEDSHIDSTYISTDNPFTVNFERDTQTYGFNGTRELEVTLSISNARGCRSDSTRIDTIRPPNALFRPDTTFGCAPLAVTFESSHSTSVEAITTYTYSWGDGTPDQTSNNDDPITHTFMQAGEYDVVLIIENASGCIDTSYAVTIEVGAPVNVDFTTDQTSICQGDSIQFMGSSIDSMLIDAWHFDTDGSRLSHCADDQNPNWIFGSMAGMMDVTVTVLYNGCPSSLTRNDFIEVKGPIAKIDYEMDCSSPFEYIFADSSMETSAVTWDFGDGNTSILQHPSHVYDETGDYLVTMTAVNGATGCPVSIDTISVHVREIKAAMEPLEDTYCIGEEFTFNAADAQDVNGTCWQGYTWFPSDTRPIETQDQTVDYAWSGRGEQTVELIVVDINGCEDVIRDTTIVFEITANFEADPIRLCAPGEVDFTDLSNSDAQIEEWKWYFNDTQSGDTIRTQNATHEFTMPTEVTRPDNSTDTVFIATLIVIDSLMCQDTLSIELEFYEPITRIDLSASELCVGDEITFNATDFTQEGNNLTYEWFLNGNNISSDPSGTITFDATLIGDNTLEVRATETNTNCPARFEARTIQVEAFPDASFTSDIDGSSINCKGETVDFVSANNTSLVVDYLWNMGDGTVEPEFSEPSMFSHPFGEGTFTVTLQATSALGCFSETSRDFTFIGPSGTIEVAQDSICLGEDITYQVSGLNSVNSYSVQFGDGEIVNDQPSGTHTYARPPDQGLYYEVRLITVFDTMGLSEPCTDFSVDSVKVGVTPDLGFFGNFEHCSNSEDMVVIDITGAIPPGALINWSPAAFVQPSGASGIIDLNNIDESFTLSATVTADGCPGMVDSLIQIFPSLDIRGDSLAILVQEGLTNFPLPPLDGELDGLNINWTPGTDLNQTDIVNPIVAQIGENSRTYIAVVTDDNGCYNEEFVRLVNIFQVPNIFSPNGDMVNANFNLLTVGDSEIRSEDIVSFQVFNRWGQRVYNNESPNSGWDGTFNGNDQPTDVYVYKIQVRLADGSTSDVIAGDVTLIR